MPRGVPNEIDYEFVRQNWNKMTHKDMAAKFHVSRQSIAKVGFAMKLPARRMPRNTSEVRPKCKTNIILQPHVAYSDFIKPPSLSQLMAGR